MRTIKGFVNKFKSTTLCFYCSVDSTELKYFLVIVIGGLALSSLFFCIGIFLKGYFKNNEDVRIKGKVLELESEFNHGRRE